MTSLVLQVRSREKLEPCVSRGVRQRAAGVSLDETAHAAQHVSPEQWEFVGSENLLQVNLSLKRVEV